MTDVDTALTNEEGRTRGPGMNAAGEDAPLAAAADPFAPPPPVEKSLTFTAELRSTRCHTADTILQPALFRIDARGIDSRVRPPHRFSLNLALVVDRSGSMNGHWLDTIKQDAAAVIDRLGPTDFLCVIGFAETADLILPSRHVTNKADAKDRIHRIAAGSSSNLQQALTLAYQQLSAVKHAGTVNLIILITDGASASGTKELNALTAQAADQRKRAISITSIGLGSDYDEELLGALAHRTGGGFHHVREPEALASVLTREIDELKKAVARSLHLKVRPAWGVNVRQVYGHPPVFGARLVEMELTEVGLQTGLKSLWELELSARPPGLYRIAQAELTYADLNTGRPERLATDIVCEFLAAPVENAENAGTDFDAEIEAAEAVRDIDKTLLAVRRQNLDASAVLQELEKVKAVFARRGRTRELGIVEHAASEIQAGGALTKTLMSTVYNLDQGKTH